MSDAYIVPAHVLMAAQQNGGLVLGAFDQATENRLVGFLFGFLARDQSLPGQPLKHYSHMMGVRPEYQGRGVGYRLKLTQREYVLAQGLDLITWTFDPLESVNATLNLSKLGVICRSYHVDEYGEMGTKLHAGLPSDRFVAEWWIRSPRVVKRLHGNHSKLTAAEAQSAGAQLANITSLDAQGQRQPVGYDPDLEADALLVEIPANIQALKAVDLELARAWRLHTRDCFSHYFAAGYVATDFIREREVARCFYLLRREVPEL